MLGVLVQFGIGGAIGTMSALAGRGGLLFRLLGIAVVSSSGQPVSRAHALLRAAVAWSPTAAALLVVTMPGEPSSGEVTLAQIAAALVLLTIFLTGAALAIHSPQAGLQDRVTRSRLVMR